MEIILSLDKRIIYPRKNEPNARKYISYKNRAKDTETETGYNIARIVIANYYSGNRNQQRKWNDVRSRARTEQRNRRSDRSNDNGMARRKAVHVSVEKTWRKMERSQFGKLIHTSTAKKHLGEKANETASSDTQEN